MSCAWALSLLIALSATYAPVFVQPRRHYSAEAERASNFPLLSLPLPYHVLNHQSAVVCNNNRSRGGMKEGRAA